MITDLDTKDLEGLCERASGRTVQIEAAELRELLRQVSFTKRAFAVSEKLLTATSKKLVATRARLDSLESGMQVVAKHLAAKHDFRVGDEAQGLLHTIRALLRANGLWRGEKPQ